MMATQPETIATYDVAIHDQVRNGLFLHNRSLSTTFKNHVMTAHMQYMKDDTIRLFYSRIIRF